MIETLNYIWDTFISLIFSGLYSWLRTCYIGIRDTIIECSDTFESVGEDFLSIMFDGFNRSNILSLNMIYLVVGMSVLIWILKTFVWHTIVSIFQSLIDLITPT